MHFVQLKRGAGWSSAKCV